MKVSSHKSHPLMSGNIAIANIDNKRIESESMHEILRITIDSDLTFKSHINKLCKKLPDARMPAKTTKMPAKN